MKTTLEHEKEIRSIKNDVTFYEIGEEGSLIPMVIDDEAQGKITEVLFCESISGGADELHDMPRQLTLTKLKMIDGELHSFSANYHIHFDGDKTLQQGIKRAIEAGKEVEYRTLDDATCYTRYDFNLQQIAVDVAERFGIGHADLKRRCNERKVSDVRHVFCAIAKTVHPEYSLKTIGSSIDRDHCTVINSLKTVRNVKELQLMYFEFCLVKRIQPDNYVDKAIEKRKILSYAGHV